MLKVKQSMKQFLHLLFALFFYGSINAQSLYFPPISGTSWETKSPESLGWNLTELQRTDSFVRASQSKAFLILKDGKIVWEKYYDSFTKDSMWYWASAGKSLTSFLVGLAVENNFINPDSPSSKYLGKGFTSLVDSAERKILVRHQLTMTSGLSDKVIDPDCTLPQCLSYLAEPGTRWAYHNAPYSLLEQVIENGTGKNVNVFIQQNLKSKTGIDGFFYTPPGQFNNIFYSTPRSLARFGLLMLNKGKWDLTKILNDSTWYYKMVTSSQNINPSYGYLWWLNGKSSYMVPGLQASIPGFLCPDAPADMYAAMGKNGQFLFVVPSQNLIMLRMGNNPEDQALVPFLLANQIWSYFKKVQPITSVNELAPFDYSVYPNPFSNKIELDSDSPVAWELFSAQGEKIMEGNSTTIQTGEIPLGTWFLLIKKGEQKLVKRLVKIE